MSAIPSLPAIQEARLHELRSQKQRPRETRESADPILGLAELTRHLDAFEGPIGLDDLRQLMARLQLSDDELQTFTLFDACNYRRNQIRRTEDYELVLICWRPGQASPIHDHAGCACVFRVLEGTGEETVYVPESDEPGASVSYRPAATSCHAGGALCASFDADIHKVSNPGPHNLCTLHVYSPPLLEMRTYDEHCPPVS